MSPLVRQEMSSCRLQPLVQFDDQGETVCVCGNKSERREIWRRGVVLVTWSPHARNCSARLFWGCTLAYRLVFGKGLRISLISINTSFCMLTLQTQQKESLLAHRRGKPTFAPLHPRSKRSASSPPKLMSGPAICCLNRITSKRRIRGKWGSGQVQMQRLPKAKPSKDRGLLRLNSEFLTGLVWLCS